MKYSNPGRLFLVWCASGILTAGSLCAQEKIFIIPANKAYAEPYESDENKVGVSIRGGDPEDRDKVDNWISKERKVVWYLYQTPGRYRMFFDQKVSLGKTLRFALAVSSVVKQWGVKSSSGIMEWKGTGEAKETFAADVDVTDTGYYRYELTALDDPSDAVEINRLLFRSASASAQVNQTNYLSSPSVHLNFLSDKPHSVSFNWLYEEVCVPEGMDPLHTFYMAIGFYRGYFGMQTNSLHERRILFSVWDSKDAEKDKTISKGDYVTLVDKDPSTTTNAFGGEGTGGQSFIRSADWKTGEPVAFLMNVLPMANNSVVISAWYKLKSQREWNYVASWRAPEEQRYFNGFHSFLENYGYENGQLRREAEYYNAWGRDAATGHWVNFNKTRFSNTDGKTGQRIDFEQGRSTRNLNRFYMSSGGYTETVKRSDTISASHLPPQLNIPVFEKRVRGALENKKIENH